MPVTRVRTRLTYANVMSTIAVFLVVGGATAIAADKLSKNSVGAKQLKKNSVTKAKLKKNSVTTAKIKNNAVTGPKVKEASLGTVPSAELANSLAPLEATHVVGAPNEPPFENGSSNPTAEETAVLDFNPVGFYKDHDGIVHLQGAALTPGTPGFIFTLPPGFRPAPGKIVTSNFNEELQAIVFGSNTVIEGIVLDGKVLGMGGGAAVLDGLTFRAES